ncbi:MAG: NTP transferase domain-containing protein [Clostridia bacterium]|nr:NTP transferase domain-containing protein [Clostridia bacterium]
MHVKKLTASCIWNSFLNSGKRHLILTGSRSCGKTTLLKELFPGNVLGLTTWAERQNAVYLRDNISRETVKVGVFDKSREGNENRMVPVPDAFETFGVGVLNNCAKAEGQWVTVDEVGYLEAFCVPYIKALEELFEKKQIAAVVRKQDIPFLQSLCLRDDAFVVDLDDPFGNIGCVIMASGLGKRFGGNKLMADFEGQPMINRILDATEDIFSRRVVVTRSEEVAYLCKTRGIETVLHDLPFRNDTVRLGIEAMEGVERCMFATGDQPLLSANTVASLALNAKVGADFIWRPMCNGVPGSPVVFPRWAFYELKDLPEGKGGSVVIKKYMDKLRTVTVRDMFELKDVDSIEDLKDILEIMEKGERLQV